MAVDFDGQIVAEGHAALPSSAGRVEGLCVEQDPHAWTTAAQQALRALTAALPHPCHIVGIAVDATSGCSSSTRSTARPIRSDSSIEVPGRVTTLRVKLPSLKSGRNA